MRFLVTLGPTYEALDDVRRLTNFSTGTLGTELSNYLVSRGHEVTALRGYYAICRVLLKTETREFTTTEHLLSILRECSASRYDVVFHAAAISDFKFGKIFGINPDGSLLPLKAGKVSTRSGVLMAELVPTPKIISELRVLFPEAKLFGWKYEVDGDEAGALEAGKKQIEENKTDFCVVNGSAYGSGFGVLSRSGSLEHAADAGTLCENLLRLASGK